VKYLKIRYSPDADVMVFELKEGTPVDSEDVADRIIVHFNEKGEPIKIEVIDASKIMQIHDIDISWEEMFKKKISV
jgi:uncharacterized protein YuzE